LEPSLDKRDISTASLEYHRNKWQVVPKLSNLISMVVEVYQLNQKQLLITKKVLGHMISHHDICDRFEDQMLLYVGGLGGTGKTHLIKAILYGLDILSRRDEVLLIATTGSAAANIGGGTYQSVLGLGISCKAGPPSSKICNLVRHKRILVLDEVSMISEEALENLSERCHVLWKPPADSDVACGGLPLIMFLGDFHQFAPIRSMPLWKAGEEELGKP
jgi:hypothetical protein